MAGGCPATGPGAARQENSSEEWERMRTRNILGLAGGAAALVAVGLAFAQEPRRDEGRDRDRDRGRAREELAKQVDRLRWAPEDVREVMLLLSPRVRDELDLTREQTERIRRVGREVAEKHRDDIRKALEAVIRATSEDMKKELDEILKPQQSKRLEQLAIQFSGPRALVDREFREKLNLTDDQEKKLREIAEDFRESAGELPRGDDPEEREEAREKAQSLWRETVKKVAGVLTSEQKAKWKELAGEPFDFDLHPGRPEDRDDDRRPREGRGRGESRKDGEGRGERPERK
jgi:hypothetical protein